MACIHVITDDEGRVRLIVPHIYFRKLRKNKVLHFTLDHEYTYEEFEKTHPEDKKELEIAKISKFGP